MAARQVPHKPRAQTIRGRSWGYLSAGEIGEPHGHRRTHRPVTAEAAAATATEATATTASAAD